MPLTAAVFDAYGTLFDVNAAARNAAREPGFAALAEAWPHLAADWRDKQVQYSWLRALSGHYCDFWQITTDALDWALARHGLDEDTDLRDRLLALYRNLAAFDEAPAVLGALKAAGHKTAILSNGDHGMLAAAVCSAGLGDRLDAVLSAAEVGTFKPDRRVYDLVETHLAVPAQNVLFVSSNGWDAAGAAAYGFTTVWVNRTGLPRDRLPGQPHHEVADLTGIADIMGGP